MRVCDCRVRTMHVPILREDGGNMLRTCCRHSCINFRGKGPICEKCDPCNLPVL